MNSIEVMDNEKSANKVVAAGLTHAPQIEQKVGEFLKSPEAGKAARLLVTTACNDLKSVTAAMVEADRVHAEEQVDEVPLRSKRDALTTTARTCMLDLRGVVYPLFGATAEQELGFKGNTPVEPATVRTTGKLVVTQLEKWNPPEPRHRGLTFDKRYWLEVLGTPVTELDSVLTHLDREARELEATQVVKNRALESYRDCFSKTANLVSTMLELAGEDELARKVRPSARKPGQTLDAEDTPPAKPA